MKQHSRVILFTRCPEPGIVKTRLIGALGAGGAAEVHRQMTEMAVDRARALKSSSGIDIEIRYAGGDDVDMRKWLGNGIRYASQIGHDLGERMENAFADGFDQGCDRIVLMGSDCPGLTADILKGAFKALEEHPVVLGPAVDGGYYLVGLKRLLPDIFTGIPWGSGAVLEKTCRTLSALNVSWGMLEPLHDVDTPADLKILESSRTDSIGVRLSVIIPALNEAACIHKTIDVARSGFPLEVMVVDGGSRDQTVQIAIRAGATVIRGPLGRALQMNAGAHLSRGDHLLFLHADTRLPDGYPSHIRGILKGSAAGGAFRFGIAERFCGRRPVEWMTNFRARCLQMPYGDQAIFVRRRDFFEMGGFTPMPIMEDYDFIRRLKKRGRIVIADAVALTSGRRWIELGMVQTMLINQLMVTGFHCGVAPEKLANFYRNRIHKRFLGGFIP